MFKLRAYALLFALLAFLGYFGVYGFYTMMADRIGLMWTGIGTVLIALGTLIIAIVGIIMIRTRPPELEDVRED